MTGDPFRDQSQQLHKKTGLLLNGCTERCETLKGVAVWLFPFYSSVLALSTALTRGAGLPPAVKIDQDLQVVPLLGTAPCSLPYHPIPILGTELFQVTKRVLT